MSAAHPSAERGLLLRQNKTDNFQIKTIKNALQADAGVPTKNHIEKNY